MEVGDFVSHWYEYDDTKIKNIWTSVLKGNINYVLSHKSDCN